MSKKDIDIAYFVSFCIEQYKKHTNLKGEAVSKLFLKNDVVDYLSANYDVLHTQSSQWLIEEIDNFLEGRR